MVEVGQTARVRVGYTDYWHKMNAVKNLNGWCPMFFRDGEEVTVIGLHYVQRLAVVETILHDEKQRTIDWTWLEPVE